MPNRREKIVSQVHFRSIALVFSLTFVLVFAACTPSLKTGDELYRDGRYKEAVESLEKYVTANPKDPVGHFTLADSLYLKYSKEYALGSSKKSDLESSLLHFSRAIELNPNYAEAHSQRGVVRLTLGDMAGSLEDYNKAMEQSPSFDRTYFNRGYWFEKQGRFAEALNDYKRYLTLSKNRTWKDDASRRIEALEMKLQLKGMGPGKTKGKPEKGKISSSPRAREKAAPKS